MELRKLQKIAVSALEDIKAKEIEILNTARLTGLFSRMIIALVAIPAAKCAQRAARCFPWKARKMANGC
jgi:ribosomal silencing factor RsfS